MKVFYKNGKGDTELMKRLESLARKIVKNLVEEGLSYAEAEAVLEEAQSRIQYCKISL